MRNTPHAAMAFFSFDFIGGGLIFGFFSQHSTLHSHVQHIFFTLSAFDLVIRRRAFTVGMIDMEMMMIDLYTIMDDLCGLIDGVGWDGIDAFDEGLAACGQTDSRKTR